MTHPPRITDESVLARWMSMEIGKINEGLVRDRKTLFRLLGEEVPCATTKIGEPYFFDRTVISVLGKNLPCELHTRLRLPMLFFMSPDVPDSCWCADAAAFETLILLVRSAGCERWKTRNSGFPVRLCMRSRKNIRPQFRWLWGPEVHKEEGLMMGRRVSLQEY